MCRADKMIPVYVLLGTIISLTLGISAQNTKKPLDTVIDKLSSIARLTNGIAIQTGMLNDTNKMDEMVAEFMGIRSGDVVKKLKLLKADGIAQKIDEFYRVVETVRVTSVNTSALQKSFDALKVMENQMLILEKNISDPSVKLKSETSTALDFIPISQYDQMPEVQKFVRILKLIKSPDVYNVADPFTNLLSPLKESAGYLEAQLISLLDFKRNLKNVLALHDISDRLREVSQFANFSEQIAANFAIFSSMNVILGNLSTCFSDLKTVIEKKASMPPDLMTLLEDNSVVALELASVSPTIRLTVGLPGGVGDLKTMFEDLKSDWMRRMIAGGKETTDLSKAMTQLSELQVKIEGFDSIWKQFDRQKYPNAVKNVHNLLSNALESGSSLPEFDPIIQSLSSLQFCFNHLNLTSEVPSYEQVHHLLGFAQKLGSQISIYQKFMESRNSTFENTFNAVHVITKLLDPLSNTLAVILDDLKAIQENNETDKLITALETLNKDFEQFQTESLFVTLKKSAVNWTAVSVLVKSLDGSNLLETLNCTKNYNFQPKDIQPVLNFGDVVQTMKNQKKDFEATKEFLVEISKVQKGLVEVGKVETKRTRRSVGPKSLTTLKNAEDVSIDLGQGVQVLREFIRILDGERSVMVAVQADDRLNKAINAIFGSERVWTEENRESLKKVVAGLKQLGGYAGTMNRDNMSALWLVFDRGSRVSRAEIDATLFGDPISNGLSSNADPNIKAAADDFKVLGGLDLNFVQHNVYLKSASLTLGDLRQFFNEFFDIKPVVRAADQTILAIETNSDESYGLGIAVATISGVVIVSLVLAVGGFALWRSHQHRRREREQERERERERRWENQERYWIYDKFFTTSGKAVSPLFAAIDANKPDQMRSFIEQGFLLNVYKNGYTLLHEAVRKANPKIVEMLILGGADVTLHSVRRKTPLEMTKELLKEKLPKKDLDELRQVLKLFEKYQGQAFKCNVHDLLPVDKFIVRIGCRCVKNKKEFKNQFSHIMWKKSGHQTHWVVETDEDGVYDLGAAREHQCSEVNCLVFGPIFSHVILVKSSWLGQCLIDEENLYLDYEHRVTKVRFDGRVYETVDEWKKWANQRSIACFYNVDYTYFSLVDRQREKKDVIEVAKMFGGFLRTDLNALCSVFEIKQPFWFPNKQRWILHHDDVQCIDAIEQQLDNDVIIEMERLSVTEFVKFLLSMEFVEDHKMPIVKATR